MPKGWISDILADFYDDMLLIDGKDSVEPIYEERTNDICQLLWDEGYRKVSPDQTLPEMPSFYVCDVRGQVWQEAVQAMLNAGFKRVEADSDI